MKFQISLAIALMALGYGDFSKAQVYPQPPEFKAVDQNGVELLSGSASLSIKLGSIGSGDGELSYSDYWGTGQIFNSLNNHFTFSYNEKSTKWIGNPGFQNSARTFWKYDGGLWSLLRYVGESLVDLPDGVTIVHTLRDGETRTYGMPPGTSSLYYLVLLSRNLPNGVVWSYNWEMFNGLARPTAVSNNLGYKISLEYDNGVAADYGNSPITVGLYFVKKVNFYNLAASMSPLATATRSTSSGVIQLVTDGGQIWQVSGSPVVPPDGVASSGPFMVKTPSASSMNSTFTPITPGNPAQNTSSTVNGVTYNYSFAFTRGLGPGGSGVTTVTDPAGGVTEISYSRYQAQYTSAAFPYQVKDALNNVTAYEVVNGYQVTSVTNPLGGKEIMNMTLEGMLQN